MGAHPTPPSRLRANNLAGAYLLTWTTYGSWLPGSEAGFVGRMRDERGVQRALNRRGTPMPADVPALRAWSRDNLSGAPTVLGQTHASALLESMQHTASRHAMRLGAVAIMPTHVHVVLRTRACDGKEAMRLLKGTASHALGERPSGRWWSRGGSARFLPDDSSIFSAITYVQNQEDPLLIWNAKRESNPPAG